MSDDKNNEKINKIEIKESAENLISNFEKILKSLTKTKNIVEENLNINKPEYATILIEINSSIEGIEQGITRSERVKKYSGDIEDIENLFSRGINTTLKKGTKINSFVAAFTLLVTVFIAFYSSTVVNEVTKEAKKEIKEIKEIKENPILWMTETDFKDIFPGTSSNESLDSLLSQITLDITSDISENSEFYIKLASKIDSIKTSDKKELIFASLIYLNQNYELTISKLENINSKELQDDKKILLLLCNYKLKNLDGYFDIEYSKLKTINSWLGFNKEEIELKLKLNNDNMINYLKEITQIEIFDASAGKKNKRGRVKDAQTLKYNLELLGWKNVTAQKLYYDKYKHYLESNLIGIGFGTQIKKVDNNIINRLIIQDIIKIPLIRDYINTKFNTPSNPQFLKLLKSNIINKNSILIIIGTEIGGTSPSIKKIKL